MRSSAVTGLLLAAGFAVIVVGAVQFTNAVEWLAYRPESRSGAAGSVLGAVATALPESTIDHDRGDHRRSGRH